MPYTEMEDRTLTKLALITERARQEPQLQFTSIAHLLNVDFLRGCYFELGWDRASGIDGVSWQDYGKQLDENLANLVERMKAKQYKPQPAKRVYIPKKNNEKRPLGLPALEDKIVQRGIARILEAIYEVDKTIMTNLVNHVNEADIKGFFDNVSHSWMIEFLQVRIKDPSFLLLISRFLKAGYMDAGEFVSTERGTPQGGNLSPALSNVFLHYVLDLWFEKRIRPQARGACYLVRYADDFICMVQYQDDAQYIEQALRDRFAKFGLELHSEKTRTLRFGRYEQENAQRQQRKANAFDFLGFTHFCGTSRRGKFIVGRQTSRKKFRQKCTEMNDWLRKIRNHKKAKDWWPALAAKLRGHYHYYGASGNMRSLNRFYHMTVRLTQKWLNRRSQRKGFYWNGFIEYLKHYSLPRPRIPNNFYTLSPMK